MLFVLDTNMASLLAIRMAQNCMLQEIEQFKPRRLCPPLSMCHRFFIDGLPLSVEGTMTVADP